MQKLNPAIVTIVIMFAIIASLGIAVRFTQIENKNREIQALQTANNPNPEIKQTTPSGTGYNSGVYEQPLTNENIQEPQAMPVAPEYKTKNLYSAYYHPTQIEYINFEFNKFDDERRYPESMRNISVKEYAELRCTPIFYFNYEYLDKPQQSQLPILISEDNTSTPDDEKLNAFAKSLVADISKEENPRYPSNIRRCETNGRDIVIYSIETGGGGGGNKVYVGYIDEDPVLIPNAEPYGAAYFGCGDPVLFTKSEKMYIRCGGGDGPAGSSSIMEVDLKNKKFKPAIACSYFYNEETEQTESKCVQ